MKIGELVFIKKKKRKYFIILEIFQKDIGWNYKANILNLDKAQFFMF
jgi:hypothetical protein